MPYVKLRGDWNGTFRRSIRDVDGTIVRKLEFTPNEPVDLTVEELAAVKGDIGKALLPLEWSDEKRKFVVIDLDEVDTEATVTQPSDEPATGEPATEAEATGEHPAPAVTDDPPAAVTDGTAAESTDSVVADSTDSEAIDPEATVAEATVDGAQEGATTNGTSNTGKRSRR